MRDTLLVVVWLLYAYAAIDYGQKLTGWPADRGGRVALACQGVVLLFALLMLLRGWWT